MLAGEKVDVKEDLSIQATKVLKEPSKKSSKSKYSFYRSTKSPDKITKKQLKNTIIPVHKVTHNKTFSHH